MRLVPPCGVRIELASEMPEDQKLQVENGRATQLLINHDSEWFNDFPQLMALLEIDVEIQQYLPLSTIELMSWLSYGNIPVEELQLHRLVL